MASLILPPMKLCSTYGHSAIASPSERQSGVPNGAQSNSCGRNKGDDRLALVTESCFDTGFSCRGALRQKPTLVLKRIEEWSMLHRPVRYRGEIRSPPSSLFA